ncbi:metal ABC transporter permease, partial [Neisseria sp. P0015.S010]
AIILCCGTLYLISVVFGWEGGILAKWLRRKKHRTA